MVDTERGPRIGQDIYGGREKQQGPEIQAPTTPNTNGRIRPQLVNIHQEIDFQLQVRQEILPLLGAKWKGDQDPEEESTSRPATPPKPQHTMSERKIPLTLHARLAGPMNYPAWLTNIKLAFRLASIGSERVWDLVEGTLEKPTTPREVVREWENGNDFALLTMFNNCEDNVRSKTEICELAREAWKVLKDAYEGKTTAESWALYEGLRKIQSDDRKESIVEHINNFELNWNRFAGIMTRVDENNRTITGLGDITKANFLLFSLPTPFYSNTIENVRAKDYIYETVVQKLTEFVPMRSKQGQWKTEAGQGTQGDPVVLKVGGKPKKDNGKGWKGLNHTEDECFTKEWEKAKTKAKKADSSNDEETDSERVTIKAIRLVRTKTNRTGYYEYDTAASHHTTNELGRLEDVKTGLSLKVEGHDGTESTCSTMGTLVFSHNNRTIRHEQCLYDPTYSNIISGLRMPDKHILKMDGGKAELKIGRKILYKMEKDEQGMWIKPEPQKGNEQINIAKVNIESVKEMHERYGHTFYNTLRTLPEFPKNIPKEKIRCRACELGKATKPPSPKQSTPIRILERIHIDLVGPIDTYPRETIQISASSHG